MTLCSRTSTIHTSYLCVNKKTHTYIDDVYKLFMVVTFGKRYCRQEWDGMGEFFVWNFHYLHFFFSQYIYFWIKRKNCREIGMKKRTFTFPPFFFFKPWTCDLFLNFYLNKETFLLEFSLSWSWLPLTIKTSATESVSKTEIHSTNRC